jgi:hypothetical protein
MGELSTMVKDAGRHWPGPFRHQVAAANVASRYRCCRAGQTKSGYGEHQGGRNDNSSPDPHESSMTFFEVSDQVLGAVDPNGASPCAGAARLLEVILTVSRAITEILKSAVNAVVNAAMKASIFLEL